MPFVVGPGYDTGVIDFDDDERLFDPSWRPRRRWPAILRTVVLLLVLAVFSVVVVPKYLLNDDQAAPDQGPPIGSTGAFGGIRGGLPPGSGITGPTSKARPDQAEAARAAEQLLRQRSEALLQKDEQAFLAGVDPRQRTFRSQQ